MRKEIKLVAVPYTEIPPTSAMIQYRDGSIGAMGWDKKDRLRKFVGVKLWGVSDERPKSGEKFYAKHKRTKKYGIFINDKKDKSSLTEFSDIRRVVCDNNRIGYICTSERGLLKYSNIIKNGGKCNVDWDKKKDCICLNPDNGQLYILSPDKWDLLKIKECLLNHSVPVWHGESDFKYKRRILAVAGYTFTDEELQDILEKIK